MSVNSKMKAIADAIRAKTGGTSALTLDGMAEAVAGIEAGGGGGFPNGTEWTQSNITTSKQYSQIHRLCYAEGVWVYASDMDYTLYYSADGVTWTPSNVTDRKVECVYYADGLFQAGGGVNSNGSTRGAYYSTDGKTWTENNLPEGGFFIRQHCGHWVAIGGDSYTSEGILYSTDGKTWTRSNVTSGYSAINRYIGHVGGVWFANADGLFYSSTDGVVWTQFADGGRLNDVCYFGKTWVAGTKNGLWYSTDGVAWTQSNVTIESTHVKRAGGIWVAGTYSGIWYSTDGMTWTQSNVTNYVRCVEYGDGVWVAGTNKGAYRSTDGMAWTKATGSYVYSVAYEAGVWVVGEYYGRIYHSTDGATWTLVDIPGTSTNDYFTTLMHNGKTWVAVHSKQGLFYSPTWLPSN